MGTEETTEATSEATIMYTTSTVTDRRALDDPSVPIRLADAKEVVRKLFRGEIEVVDNTPSVITLEKKKVDGTKSDIDLGEGLPTVHLEKGLVESRYVFTPMAGSKGADRDMSELNKFVRRFRRTS